MRILLLTTQVPFTRGGAENLTAELLDALCSRGCEAERVAIPFSWYPPARIIDQILACRLLDIEDFGGMAVDRVIGLKFPAYAIPHSNKVLWIMHQHRTAYHLWDRHPHVDLIHHANGQDVRDAIRELDTRFIGEARAIYTISRNVSKRLKSYNGIDSSPLYHPPRHAHRFRSGPSDDYVFFPSRIHPSKRQALVLEALVHTTRPVRVVFAGRAEPLSYAEQLKVRTDQLGLSNRVTWLGEVDDDTLIDLYTRCRGVVFAPVDEDYGYVTLEAMLSAKAVVTCDDSGGSLEFVRDGITGRVVPSTPEALGATMDELWADSARANAMGQAGRGYYDELGIGWDRVVEKLLA